MNKSSQLACARLAEYQTSLASSSMSLTPESTQ
jgi:hypothetical protein